ncbi:sigma factor-like helix-turn-helix DNA-binding protein [Actinoplanes solisilvae]
MKLLNSSLPPLHNDVTLDDAAVELGVPVGTVKSRAFYAMKSVRDAPITE